MSSIRQDHPSRLPCRVVAHGAAALALLMLLALPASAQQLQPRAATEPAYIIYPSHVEWVSPGAAATNPGSFAYPASQPTYIVYPSHVAWKSDAVHGTGPDWAIYHAYPSHIGWDANARPVLPLACNDLCSGAHYSWDDVTRFFNGR